MKKLSVFVEYFWLRSGISMAALFLCSACDLSSESGARDAPVADPIEAVQHRTSAQKAPEQNPAPQLNPGAAAANIEKCRALCSQTAAAQCERHEICEPTCNEVFGMDACSAQIAGFLSCSIAAPLEAFECSPEGTPALKDGHCEAEQEAVARCVTKAD